MNSEQRLLISICRAYFSGTAPDIPEGVNWDELFKLARAHNQMGVCHCVFNDNRALNAIPDSTRQRFGEYFLDLIMLYEMQMNALAEIKAVLDSNDIGYIIFKGAYLRSIYPIAESRSMGDIDILISPEHRRDIKQHMEQIGFELSCSNATVDTYTRGNVILELHTRLTDEFGDEAFEDAFENSKDCILDDSYHLAYLIAHMGAHLKINGAGIGLLLDLAIMQRERDIDIDRVLNLLDKIGLKLFGQAVLSLCFELFGIGCKYTDNTDKLLEYLISFGVFSSVSLLEGKTSSDMTVSRLMELGALDNGKGGKLRTLLLMAFPPYSVLRKAPYLTFLNGRPYLLIFAWCYRLIYNLLHHRRHMVKTIKNIDDDKTTALANEELRFFEEIGLK